MRVPLLRVGLVGQQFDSFACFILSGTYTFGFNIQYFFPRHPPAAFSLRFWVVST